MRGDCDYEELVSSNERESMTFDRKITVDNGPRL